MVATIMLTMNVNIYETYIFELRMKDRIEERSSQLVRKLVTMSTQTELFSQLLKFRTNCEDLSSI